MSDDRVPVQQLVEDDRPVTRGTFELKLKVLEQRLTLKLIAGLIAAQALSHVSIPPGITTTASAGLSFLPLQYIGEFLNYADGLVFALPALAIVLVKIFVLR